MPGALSIFLLVLTVSTPMQTRGSLMIQYGYVTGVDV
jgi:hypothetical protein